MSADAEAFDAFATRNGPSLVRLGYSLTGDRRLAEDLAQEALARCWIKWRAVSAADNPDAYLRRVAVNTFLSSRRRRRVSETSVARPEQLGPDPSEQVVQRQVVWQALASLTRAQRAVLVLRYFEDLPDEQIAQLLGCPTSTVRSHANRALGRLRALPGVSRTGRSVP